MKTIDDMTGEELAEMYEPLGELVLIEVVRQTKVGSLFVPGDSAAATLTMRVLRAQGSYVNHMGIVIPIRVKPGDHIVPTPDAGSRMLPVRINERQRKRAADAKGVSVEAVEGLFESEVVLLPYTKIAMIDHSRGLSPRLIKPETKKPGYAGRGEYEQ